jgi:hypothetical protein
VSILGGLRHLQHTRGGLEVRQEISERLHKAIAETDQPAATAALEKSLRRRRAQAGGAAELKAADRGYISSLMPARMSHQFTG